VYKVNISIDDITPHPHSSTKVLDRCFELIDIFPNIKFTLFVPVAYYRTIESPPQSVCKSPLYLYEHPDFCEKLLNLPDSNFEIGFHGVYHGIPNVSNNDEFKDLDEDETMSKVLEMFRVVNEAGLASKMELVFRPPAFKMSADSIRVMRRLGFVFALHDDPYYTDTYGGEHLKKDRMFFEDIKADDVVCVTGYPPHKPLNFLEKTEIMYHACDWDKNYLSEDLCSDLVDFLNSSYEYEFCFMKGLLN